MNGFQPDLVAVLVAAVAGLLIGGLWYSPMLLGNLWMSESGVKPEQIAASRRARTLGAAFVALLAMSYCLALFIGPAGEVAAGFFSPSQQGAFHGFQAGFGWLFFGVVVVGLFELRSVKYMIINGGYWVVAMTTMGGILGGWS